MSKVYIANNGKVLAECKEEELKQKYRDGELEDGCFIWNDSEDDWLPIKTYIEHSVIKTVLGKNIETKSMPPLPFNQNQVNVPKLINEDNWKRKSNDRMHPLSEIQVDLKDSRPGEQKKLSRDIPEMSTKPMSHKFKHHDKYLPYLWDPNVSARLSLFFGPVLGELLNFFNWEQLGGSSKNSLIFWSVIELGCLLAMAGVRPSNFIFVSTTMIVIFFAVNIIWFFTTGKKYILQIELAAPKYVARSFALPALLCVLIFAYVVYVPISINKKEIVDFVALKITHFEPWTAAQLSDYSALCVNGIVKKTQTEDNVRLLTPTKSLKIRARMQCNCIVINIAQTTPYSSAVHALVEGSIFQEKIYRTCGTVK